MYNLADLDLEGTRSEAADDVEPPEHRLMLRCLNEMLGRLFG